jgi:hypothetical protein
MQDLKELQSAKEAGEEARIKYTFGEQRWVREKNALRETGRWLLSDIVLRVTT